MKTWWEIAVDWKGGEPIFRAQCDASELAATLATAAAAMQRVTSGAHPVELQSLNVKLAVR